MNKLIIEKEKVLEIKDNVINLDIKTNELTINVKGMVMINEFKKQDEQLKLTINIDSNSSLLYNRLVISNKINNHITINKEENANAIVNYSLLLNDESNLTIDGNIKGNAEINIRIANDKKTNITNNLKEYTKIKENSFKDNISDYQDIMNDNNAIEKLRNGYLISNLDITNKMQKEIKELLGGE